MSQQTTPHKRWRSGPGLGVLLLVLLSLLQVASASQLSIAGAKVGYAASFAACSRNAITVTNLSATQASVSGLNASNCSGKSVQLWVRDTTGTLNATTISLSTSTSTMTLPAYTPSSVAVAIVYVGGWPVPTTWNYTPPVTLPVVSCEAISGGGTCAVIETIGTSWTNNGQVFWQKTFRVSTTSSSEVPWQVTINLSNPSLPAVSNVLQDLQGGLVVVSTSGCSASPRTVTVKGTTNWSPYNTVTTGRYSEFQVQGSNSGSGNLLSC